ncbi:uncharacterized protein LOC119480876 [Sebastes umbrosus]|uniref:uncharacterized protein LOC119480876 n=1 Tax=Sebastes umbrosus TaxID=72105 RepID=UPI00189C5BBB|nr:uncharacterized protein LOC119480876 [Sebastes umbrosus]
MSDCTCAVLGCKPEPGSSIHYLPRNPVLKQLWMDFIYRHSRPANTVVIRICGAHFSSDCFVNFCQRSMGFAKKLILKPDAVPSIYPGSHPGLQHGPAALCLKRADVACQYNSVVLHDVGLQCSLPVNRTRTVGTQLSERRLIYRRSLGVQTKLHTTGAGTVETRTAEQSVGRLISSSQKPPPSPPADWSQPEIEDDDQCVTVVTHLLLQVSFSLMEESRSIITVLQKWMSVRI